MKRYRFTLLETVISVALLLMVTSLISFSGFSLLERRKMKREWEMIRRVLASSRELAENAESDWLIELRSEPKGVTLSWMREGESRGKRRFFSGLHIREGTLLIRATATGVMYPPLTLHLERSKMQMELRVPEETLFLR